MHILLGKKQIVLTALVAALGLAVFVNWYYSKNGAEIPNSVFTDGGGQRQEVKKPDGKADFVGENANDEKDEYFACVRLERNSVHDAAMEDLQSVLASAAEDGEAAKETAKAIEKLTGVIKMETDIESLVKGETGGDCVAVISDNTVEIMVKPDALNDSNVLKITDVVGQVCEGKYENIKISGTVG